MKMPLANQLAQTNFLSFIPGGEIAGWDQLQRDAGEMLSCVLQGNCYLPLIGIMYNQPAPNNLMKYNEMIHVPVENTG